MAFYKVCREGNVDKVKLLLLDRSMNPNKADNDGITPFHYVCWDGHLEIVKILLADPRIDPCKPDNDGWTPFHSACRNGHLEIVKILLADPRIDPCKSNNNGKTPLDVAREWNWKTIIDLITEHLSGLYIRPFTNRQFLYASANGNVEFMKNAMRRRPRKN